MSRKRPGGGRDPSVVPGVAPFTVEDGFDNLLIKEASGDATATRTAQTNFDGGTHLIYRQLRFNRVKIDVPVVTVAGGTLVAAIYQAANGLTNQPWNLITVASTGPVNAAGVFTLVLAGDAILSPGACAVLYGRTAAGGGNFTFTVWNGVSAPLATSGLGGSYPCTFTTVVPVNVAPPATLDITAQTPGAATALALVTRVTRV